MGSCSATRWRIRGMLRESGQATRGPILERKSRRTHICLRLIRGGRIVNPKTSLRLLPYMCAGTGHSYWWSGHTFGPAGNRVLNWRTVTQAKPRAKAHREQRTRLVRMDAAIISTTRDKADLGNICKFSEKGRPGWESAGLALHSR